MARIYRTNEKIPVKIGGLVFKISPLSRIQKAEIQALMTEGKINDSAYTAVKYAVKDVSGLRDDNGEYKLSFDDSGYLDEETLDDLTNIAMTDELQTVCLALVSGVPDKFMDPITGEKLKGVDYAEEAKPRKKSKKVG